MSLSKHQKRFYPFSTIVSIVLLGSALLAMCFRYEIHNRYNSQAVLQDSDLPPHLHTSIPAVPPYVSADADRSTGTLAIVYQQMDEIARLEGLHDQLTIERLTKLLTHGSDTTVRQRAVEMLAKIDNSLAADVITQGLGDGHELVREATLHALLTAHHNDIDLILGQTLYGDRSARIRLLAVELLSNRYNSSAETFLIVASRDKHAEVREMAEQVLNVR